MPRAARVRGGIVASQAERSNRSCRQCGRGARRASQSDSAPFWIMTGPGHRISQAPSQRHREPHSLEADMAAIDDISFVGLIGNRQLESITTNEFMNALARCGWGEAHNAHILMRLRERGIRWGIFTPNDLRGSSATAIRSMPMTEPRLASAVTANAGSSTGRIRAASSRSVIPVEPAPQSRRQRSSSLLTLRPESAGHRDVSARGRSPLPRPRANTLYLPSRRVYTGPA